MASPDATPFIDLILRDQDPQELVDLAIEVMKVDIPGWEPREGNIEMVLLEGLSTVVAELIYTVNNLPSSVVQALLKLNSIEHDDGQEPEVTLRFNFSGVGDLTIPAETAVVLELDNDEEPITFTTSVEATNNPGETWVDSLAVGDRKTAVANGIDAGTQVTLIDSVLWVDSVVLQSEVASGRDAETDLAYFTRGIQRFQRLTSVLVTPDQFVAFALEQTYVESAHAIDLYDAEADTDDNGPYGADAGHMTLAVYGDGANVGAADKTTLTELIEDMIPANLVFHMIDPTPEDVAVNVTVVKEADFTEADVEANIEAAVEAYFLSGNWPFARNVYRNDIIALVTNVVGVSRVTVLTTPAADLAFTSPAPLTNLTSVTVNFV